MVRKNVPQGFKQTEIGMIPQEWEVQLLEDLTTKIGDGIHSVPYYINTGDYLFINGNNLKKGKIVYDEFTKRTTKNEFYKYKRDLTKRTILLSINGTIGNIAFYNDEKVILGKSIAYINVNNKIENKYLYYFLQTSHVSDFFNNELTGSTINNLGLSSIRNTPIILPNEMEQRSIIEILSNIDQLITSLDKLIEKKKMIKKGMMQDILTGRRRLDGFDSEWTTEKLGDIATISGAGVDKKTNEKELPITLLNFLDVHKNNYIYRSQMNHLVTAKSTKIAQCNVLKGDIFITPSSELQNDIGVTAISMENMEDVVYSYHINRIRLIKKFNILFSLYMFKTSSFLKQANVKCEGSGKRYVISLKSFRDMELFFPESLKEQKAIAEILYDMDSEIYQLERKLSKYKFIKQGMMQKLLTGQIRLISKPKHNKAINEAVLISVLSHYFGSEDFPLGRKRYTKLSYLFHRHTDGKIEDYVKKAAGPYNPKTKYEGSERIALQKSYMVKHKRDKFAGFISGSNFNEAESYFLKWYDQDSLNWLLQFKKNRNDYLELLATVDSAIIDLKSKNTVINVVNIIGYINNIEEWKPKLERDIFAAKSIENALNKCFELFDY
ncbi:MAG: restriction endonuclease subunit S [Candidatus Cloacimonetes bacterium]|nr:restriction endonuclease subunit S [Candidatus Cloacimonadota bacterium]MCF7861568.1 restriction endonuclease subunit S [Candidatus Woesearchaeota archaeon]